jgi:hypothetical protein
MGLLADLKSLEENSLISGIACSAGTALKEMKEEERNTLQTILDNKSVPVAHLLKALKDNGFDVSERALYKHRKKHCRCFK